MGLFKKEGSFNLKNALSQVFEEFGIEGTYNKVPNGFDLTAYLDIRDLSNDIEIYCKREENVFDCSIFFPLDKTPDYSLINALNENLLLKASSTIINEKRYLLIGDFHTYCMDEHLPYILYDFINEIANEEIQAFIKAILY